MAAALDHAHRHGVIHRDIKPANIMLDYDVTVKITDFGIAKVVSDASQTLTNFVMGTPSYMSPEQIEARPLDGRSDQFSLAAVAYQLLTGAVPFQTDSLPSSLHQIVYAPRPSARAASPTLPAAVDDVLRRALERDAAERYSSCAEFVEALESAMREAPVIVPAPSPKASSRRPMAIVAAAVCVVAVAAVAFVFVPGRNHPSGAAPVETTKPPVHQVSPPAAIPLPTIPARTADISVPNTPSAPINNAQRALQIYKDAEADRILHPEQGLVLLRQAAVLGELRAMNELAEALVESRGVDDPEALQWFHIAADRGNASAMVHMGVMSLLGTGGVNKDPLEAAKWFGKAANAGSAAGMYDLATMYDDGQGIPEDPVKAKDLYRRAAALGHLEAKQRLAQLSQ
jgi:Protein kinase domain/Sel1 repeat